MGGGCLCGLFLGITTPHFIGCSYMIAQLNIQGQNKKSLSFLPIDQKMAIVHEKF